jgi:hypothetical protein
MKRSKVKKVFSIFLKERKRIRHFFFFLLGLLLMGFSTGCWWPKGIIRKGEIRELPDFSQVEAYLKSHPNIDKVEKRRVFTKDELGIWIFMEFKNEEGLRVFKNRILWQVEYGNTKEGISGALRFERNHKGTHCYYRQYVTNTSEMFGRERVNKTWALMKEIEKYLVEHLNMEFTGRIEMRFWNAADPDGNKIIGKHATDLPSKGFDGKSVDNNKGQQQ